MDRDLNRDAQAGPARGRRADEQRGGAGARSGPEPRAAVLGLQRSAGNAAVAQALQPVVQRQDLGGVPLPVTLPAWSTVGGFATGSADLPAGAEPVIAQVAADLQANPLGPADFVTVTGYADRRGSAEDNHALGQRRADAVRQALVGLLPDPDQASAVRAYSLGEPTSGPETDEPALRKVEIAVTRRPRALPSLGLPPLTPGGAPGPGGARPPDLVLHGLPPGSRAARLPDWFWTQAYTRRPDATDPESVMAAQRAALRRVSERLTGALGRGDLAGIAADLGQAVGMGDRADLRRSLEDALVGGGEAGLRALLEQAVDALAGALRTPAPPGSAAPPQPSTTYPGTVIVPGPTIRW